MPTDGSTEPHPRAPAVEPIPRAARAAALAGALLGLIGVLGWLLDLPAALDVLPSLPKMQPNTALALVACGLALALPDRAGNLARLAALFPAVIGVLTMLEYVTGGDFGIDDLFVRGTMRMAPQTAVSFVFTALAVLARRTPGWERLVQPLALVPAALCYLSLVGLLFDAQVPVFPLATTMALNTGVAFLLVAFGLALSQPRRGLLGRWRSAGPGGRTTRLLLPAFVVLPPLLALLAKAGESAGAYDEGFGIALEATVMMLLLAAGVLLRSRGLDAAEADRALQAGRFRTIVENIPEGVCVMDICGQVLYANSRLSALLDRPAAPGLSLTDCVDPEVHSFFHDFLRQSEHASARATVAVRGQDGVLRSLRFSATPVPDPLSSRGSTLLLVIDDTSRRLAESRLRERAHELERALRDLDAFAALASHDLREPLRKIQLLADGAADDAGNADGPMLDRLHRIHRLAALLQRRVADVLAYSRLGASARIVRNVDIGAVVRDVERQFAPRLHDAGAAVLIGVMPTIDGDPTLLRTLFEHLFDNALKFARRDVPLVLRVTSEPRSAGRVEITVADNGLGFDEQDAEHIFGVFRTLHPRERYAGSGIGLASCLRIAELHGGTISARGTPGEGSVFTISLRVRAPTGAPAECVPADV
ncbi:MAG: ATP-binding protein [Pseudomonadota bacterium]|nr:ATP-binding protein [Pseudomonadota bacterium]